MYTAGQDRTAALSSGFTVAKEPEPTPPMATPEAPSVSDGQQSREQKVSVPKVSGAKAYLFHYTQHPLTDSSQWQMLPGSTRQRVITDLEVGQRYWFKVTAIGVNDQVLTGEATLSQIVR